MSGESIVGRSNSGGVVSAAGRGASVTLGAAGTASSLAAGAGARMATGAARGVRARIERRLEAARAAAAEEERRTAEWQRQQAQQHREMEALQQQLSDFWDTHRGLAGAAPQRSEAPPRRGRAQAKGYLNDGAGPSAQDQAQALIEEVDNLINNLPERVVNDPEAPFVRLKQEAERQQAQLRKRNAIYVEGVASFKETVERTIAEYKRTLERKREGQRRLVAQAREMLHELAGYDQLTNRHADAIAAARQRLEAMLMNETLTPVALDALQTELNEMRTRIEEAVTLDAERPELAAAVTRHLEDMDYQALQPFPEEPGPEAVAAAMRIPGGEQIKITLHSDGRLAFQLSHEGEGQDQALSEEDVAFLRQQEERWCGDLEELMRSLVAEGFPCEMEFERKIPEHSIPVARMETPGSWEEETDDESRERRRDVPHHGRRG